MGVDLWARVCLCSPQMKKPKLSRVMKIRLSEGQARALSAKAQSTGIAPGTLARIAIVTYLAAEGAVS